MTEEDSKNKTTEDTDTEGRGYWDSPDAAQRAGYCGRTNREGEPCHLPAGWGTPGTSERGDACRFHGGASTGPNDTAHLKGNDRAVGNDGGPPEGNTNALQSGAHVPLDRLPERLAREQLHSVARWEWYGILVARKRRPDLREGRRRRLAARWARLDVRRWSALFDILTDGSDGGRGFTIERERTVETAAGNEVKMTEEVANPSLAVGSQSIAERHEVADILGLHDHNARRVKTAETRAAPPRLRAVDRDG